MTYEKVALLYDAVIGDMDYKAWTRDIYEVLKKHSIKPKLVLDLACGTGNHIEFLKKKFKVIGIDNSKEMIKIARKKHPEIKFYVKDMKIFSIKEKPDLVLCLYDSINNLKNQSEILNCFKSVHKCLKKNGTFIFDVATETSFKEMKHYKVQAGTLKDAAYIWINDYKNKKWYWTFTSFIKKQGKLYQRYDESHIEYAYSVDVLKKLLKTAGFELIEYYDAYRLGVVDQFSERINFVCKRP